MIWENGWRGTHFLEYLAIRQPRRQFSSPSLSGGRNTVESELWWGVLLRFSDTKLRAHVVWSRLLSLSLSLYLSISTREGGMEKGNR